MRVAILQSNYVPWRGYFDLMDDVDLFIYLDDTQYTRRDWRNRNKIKTNTGSTWITVPVNDKYGSVLVEDTPIDYERDWASRHINLLEQWYREAPFFADNIEAFQDHISVRYDSISSLNEALNNWIIKLLGISTQICFSREFGKQGAKDDRLLDILAKVGATHYLSGPAAKSYIQESKFREAGITLEYKTYDYGEYPQMYSPFEPAVSVLDLLFNCGPDSRRYLKSLSPNEAAW